MNLLREKQRACGAHRLQGGLFGGGDSNSEANQTSNQYDQRATATGSGAAVSGSNNVVTNTSTDMGAVTAGIDLARRALAVGVLSAEESAAQTRQVFNSALTEVGKAYETAKAGDQRIVSMVGLAVFGIALAVTVPAMFKKG